MDHDSIQSVEETSGMSTTTLVNPFSSPFDSQINLVTSGSLMSLSRPPTQLRNLESPAHMPTSESSHQEIQETSEPRPGLPKTNGQVTLSDRTRKVKAIKGFLLILDRPMIKSPPQFTLRQWEVDKQLMVPRKKEEPQQSKPSMLETLEKEQHLSRIHRRNVKPEWKWVAPPVWRPMENDESYILMSHLDKKASLVYEIITSMTKNQVEQPDWNAWGYGFRAKPITEGEAASYVLEFNGYLDSSKPGVQPSWDELNEEIRLRLMEMMKQYDTKKRIWQKMKGGLKSLMKAKH